MKILQAPFHTLTCSLLCFSVCLFAGCITNSNRHVQSPKEIPVPPQASPAKTESSLESPLDNALNKIIAQLREANSDLKVDDVLYSVPHDIQWTSIESFYDDELDQRKMTRSSAKSGKNYQYARWSSKTNGAESIVIVKVDVQPPNSDTPESFLVVMVTR